MALANLQANLELEDVAAITDATKSVVQAYNKDDCISAAGLRDWLETLRDQLIAGGVEVPRPKPGETEVVKAHILDTGLAANPVPQCEIIAVRPIRIARRREHEGTCVPRRALKRHAGTRPSPIAT